MPCSDKSLFDMRPHSRLALEFVAQGSPKTRIQMWILCSEECKMLSDDGIS